MIDDTYGFEKNVRCYKDYSPTLRNERIGLKILELYRIRKLTETECLRLMGFKDEDIKKTKDIGVSNSQLYKQAGNGIVTNCVELIFEHLYKAQYNSDFKCYDENFT